MSESDPRPTYPLPVVTSPVHGGEAVRPREASAFDAQLLGQGGARKGLRGGAPVLDEATHTYLETEWSGPSDRRTRAGAARREKV